MDIFEQSFGEFLDGSHYDQTQETLFLMVRSAYIAGYEAALAKETTSNVLKLDFEANI